LSFEFHQVIIFIKKKLNDPIAINLFIHKNQTLNKIQNDIEKNYSSFFTELIFSMIDTEPSERINIFEVNEILTNFSKMK
jgi:hypothetical protein